MTSKKRIFDTLIILTLLWVAVLSQSAYAAALQVDSFIDDTTPSDGLCSLREAISNANSNSDTTGGDCVAGSGADSIFLPAGTHLLALAGTPDDDENANAAGDLDISGDLTINGVTASVSIVDGNHSDRVFHILSGTVTFNNLAVQNGTSADGTQGANCNFMFCMEEGETGAPGGGIYNQGTLTLFQVTVKGNQTGNGGDAGDVDCPGDNFICETRGGEGGAGGGIYNSGSLTLNQSRVAHNQTGGGGPAGTATCGLNENGDCFSSEGTQGEGGGIAGAESGGSMLIFDSTLSGNTALNAGAILQNVGALFISNSSFEANTAVTGGALICNSNSQSCDISGSTFSGNYATGGAGGGAIAFFNNGSKFISNSTISGNTSQYDGGGIRAYSSSGGVGLQFVTIANNTTIAGDGGGLGITISNLQVRNSILANNIDQGGQSPDCNGGFNSGGYNLIGNPTGCPFIPATGDMTNVDPLLGPLAFNGGLTQTHALRFSSPALDAGDGTGYEADQRGVPRPFNHPDASAGEVADQPAGIVPDADIGAVEMRAILVTNADDSGTGSLRQALLDANGNGLGHDDILFEESFFSTPRTINLASALGVIQTSLNLIGTGANKLDVHRQTGGEYRIFQSSGAVLDMVFSGLTISNGFSAGDFGGGMYISNDLVLAEVAVVGSQATSGGGVYLGNGSGTFINSTFSNNTATRGGGVAFFGNISETLRLVNCTFSGNNGGDAGGGVRHASNGAYSTLEVINTTFANNVAPSGSAVSTEAFSPGQSPATTLLNSIFTGGAFPQVAAAAFGGSTVIIKSLGYNLSSDNGGGFLTAIGDKTNSNPLLGPLTLSAGTTRTHVPQAGSPAYDAGSCASGTVYKDQRGFARPVDLPVIINAFDGCDIGAVEWTGDENGDGFEDGVVVWANGFE